MVETRLILGDCLELLPTLAAGSVDAIITDLPYGTTACKWDVVIPFAPMWEQVKRVLKPRGVFVTTASQPFTSKLVMSNLEWFRFEIIWDKVNRHTGFLDVNRKPLKRHENILVFGEDRYTCNPQMGIGEPYVAKRSGKHAETYNDFKVIDGASDGTRYPTSLLPIKADSKVEMGLHPTQKPVALYAYLIRTYTNAGDTVLDFCMGSGTTGVAAVKEGRNFIGFDSDRGYYDIATKRIAEAQMQMPLLEVFK